MSTAFRCCSALTRVIFAADGCLRAIDGFACCVKPARIEIPGSVSSIGSEAFLACTSLEEVAFAPDGRLETLSGFRFCSALVCIEIPSSVVKITNDAFCDCESLQRLIFHPTGGLVAVNGFRRCQALERIEFPMSVAKLFGFADCPALREVRFPPGSALHILEAFKGSSLRVIRIPSSVPLPLLPRIAFVEYLDNHRMKQSRRPIHLIQAAPCYNDDDYWDDEFWD
jgi:hypothetical protein